MIIREYKTLDCKELVELFYNTVHTVNAKDYTKEQLSVWASDKVDLEKWNKSLKEFNMKRAIFISSLLFGLMHFNIMIMIFAYGIGVISCKIYDKTGEIRYSILFHAISNLFSVIFHNYITFNVYNGGFSLSAIQIILI